MTMFVLAGYLGNTVHLYAKCKQTTNQHIQENPDWVESRAFTGKTVKSIKKKKIAARMRIVCVMFC